MHMLDLQIGITLVDQLAERDSTAVRRHVGNLHKARLECGEIFRSCLRPGMLILCKDDRTLIADNRDDGPVEPSLPDGACRALLTFEREGIHRFTADAF